MLWKIVLLLIGVCLDGNMCAKVVCAFFLYCLASIAIVLMGLKGFGVRVIAKWEWSRSVRVNSKMRGEDTCPYGFLEVRVVCNWWFSLLCCGVFRRLYIVFLLFFWLLRWIERRRLSCYEWRLCLTLLGRVLGFLESWVYHIFWLCLGLWTLRLLCLGLCGFWCVSIWRLGFRVGLCLWCRVCNRCSESFLLMFLLCLSLVRWLRVLWGCWSLVQGLTLSILPNKWGGVYL